MAHPPPPPRPPPRVVLLDAYGTLLDVHCVAGEMDRLYPGRGAELAAAVRDKQLAYTRLLTMAGPAGERYLPFADVTRRALRFCCARLGLPLGGGREAELFDQYRRLAPFPEVASVLEALRGKGVPLAILTNGDPPFIRPPVDAAGIGAHLDDVISVDAARLYKPHPAAYALGLAGARKLLAGRGEAAGRLCAEEVMLVSSNCWDVAGAAWFGLRTFWVNRGGAPLEELGVAPDHEGTSLSDLLPLFGGAPS